MSALQDALAACAPIGLEALDAAAALRTRSDSKHVLTTDALADVIRALAPTHRALEIDGRRTFAYDTIYFDTPDLLTARAHVQGRRRRFKCRTRLYVDTGSCAFEVKVKGGRGETVKHRLDYEAAAHGTMTRSACAFLAGHAADVGRLAPSLRTTYRRLTLVAEGERLTADLDLVLGGVPIRPGHVVVEAKSATGDGPAAAALRAAGSRPVALSKYVLGVGLSRAPGPPAALRQTSRRWFAHA